MGDSLVQDSIAASSSQVVTSPRDAMVEQAVSSFTEVRRRTTSPVSPTSPRVVHERYMSPRMLLRKGKEKASPDEELLNEVTERSDDGEVSEQGTDGDELFLVDYEADRQRRIRENQALLTSLGIHSSQTVILNAEPDLSPNQVPLRRRKKVTGPRFDRSGYVLSLPERGEKQIMACVEIPADRKVRKRIAEGAYVDRSWWSVGEERRWRFGYGEGVLEPGERPVVGGVAPDFRWREWRGVKEELRAERKQIDDLIDKDMRAEQNQDQGVSAYSLISGQACHQCRRKSEKPKMQCRNVNPACRAAFCESCCKRYSYFDFDPDARSFICPLCKGCCNCANCLRKRNLSHLLDAKGGGIDKKQLEAAGGLTVQAWIEKAAEQRETLPFDRVRLVDKDTDVISPDLPEPVDVVMTPVKGGGKKRRKEETLTGTGTGTGTGNGIRSGSKVKKAKKIIMEKGLEEEPIVIKLRLPAAAKPQTKKSPVKPNPKAKKVKQYDSDGETVGGYSSDDMSSRLTSPPRSQSPEPEPVLRRFAFPPRRSQSTNDFLSSVVDASHTPPVDPSFNLDHALPVPPTFQAPLMDDMLKSRTVYDAFAATIGQTNGVMSPYATITPDSAPLMAMRRSASATSPVPSPALHNPAPPNMEVSMIHTPTDEFPQVAPVPGLPPNLVSLPRFDSSTPQLCRSGGSTTGWIYIREWKPFPTPS